MERCVFPWLRPSDRFESVQLFVKHEADNTVLNELFAGFYILSQAFDWQGMSSTVVARTTADVEVLGSSVYPAIAASKLGPELPRWPYLSKTFAAYFSTLAAAAPYYKTTDTRNKLEQRFNKALRELNKIDDDKFQM